MQQLRKSIGASLIVAFFLAASAAMVWHRLAQQPLSLKQQASAKPQACSLAMNPQHCLVEQSLPTGESNANSPRFPVFQP